MNINKIYVIVFNSDNDYDKDYPFDKITMFDNKKEAIKELQKLYNITTNNNLLDYRIEVFEKINNKFKHSGEIIRINDI